MGEQDRHDGERAAEPADDHRLAQADRGGERAGGEAAERDHAPDDEPADAFARPSSRSGVIAWIRLIAVTL